MLKTTLSSPTSLVTFVNVPSRLFLNKYILPASSTGFPNASAAALLPDAAAANPSVFYNSSGQPRSLAQIYQHFAQKFDGTSSPAVSTALLTNTQTMQPAAQPAPMLSYAIASAAYTGSTRGAYTSPIAGGIKADTPSLFASMIMAQMDMSKMRMAAFGTSTSANHDNKNAWTDLAAFG